MTRVFPNADVWVIQDDTAMLYRQHEQTWQLENRMPFDEFSGSAVALSSFALPDTSVFLNIPPQSIKPVPSNEPAWTGIAQDPLRLIHIRSNPEHQQVLQALRITGKKVNVISTPEPHHFLRGTALQITDCKETGHLKRWVSAVNKGSSTRMATTRLALALWLKPGSAYQLARAVVLVCTFAAFAFGQWSAHQQKLKHTLEPHGLVQQELQHAPDRQHAVSFDDWATQIRKFGQEKRANISELSIYWDEAGHVHSLVSLARDRKRVPKGCQLLDSKQAECQSPGSQP